MPGETAPHASVLLSSPPPGSGDFYSGIARIVAALTVFTVVGFGCIYAFNKPDPASCAGAGTDSMASEINRLRSDVAYLLQQEQALRAEIRLLTQSGGVLPRLIDRIKRHRAVNASHANAIHQLFSSSNLTGNPVPGSADGPSPFAVDRPQRVQVTPVNAKPQTDRSENTPLTAGHQQSDGG
ncbi:hypothetical protein [Nitratireductor sp. XY-223]|uniref:hypothetical protein n=1 Tax=Nitratireductor sp. XY-223 TaxID=2561926 RepID=UPI0010A9A03E|nr:hypothetical protein [Nitratireductor sp. XY-223]